MDGQGERKKISPLKSVVRACTISVLYAREVDTARYVGSLRVIAYLMQRKETLCSHRGSFSRARIYTRISVAASEDGGASVSAVITVKRRHAFHTNENGI